MAFWIFMLIMDLLIPFTMIGFGKLFLKKSLEMNRLFGYRTSMSMKNKETWRFAHQYCGRIWYISGLVLLPITIIPMLFVIHGTEDMIGMIGGIVCILQMVPLVGVIIPTEMALRKTFDRDGKKKVPVQEGGIAMVRKHITFSGRVQGVGFRYRAQMAAQQFGLTGWVRNANDGSVSMEVQGPREMIDKMLQELDQGMYIRIDKMQVKDISLVEGEYHFSVRGY